MNCCQCQGIEELFNEKLVAKELAHYRKRGFDQATRILIHALRAEGIQGYSLLDIGGGVGAIQHALIDDGVDQAVDVDASHAYLEAAKREAKRRGLAERIHFHHGNFVDLAPIISSTDIVTLNRVICCYHDVVHLVSLSAARAEKLYGLVYPRNTWWVKIGFAILNFFLRLQGSPFRTFMHPNQLVEDLVNRHGLQRRFYHKTMVWQISVYSRS